MVRAELRLKLSNNLLRIRRKSLGLTQAQVAQAAQIRETAYNAIENLHHWPRPETQTRIATALAVDVEDVFDPQMAQLCRGSVSHAEEVETAAALEWVQAWEQRQVERSDPSRALEEGEADQVIAEALNELTRRERMVLVGVFWEGRTLADLGVDLMLNGERVRQIKERAVAKLHVALASRPGVLRSLQETWG